MLLLLLGLLTSRAESCMFSTRFFHTCISRLYPAPTDPALARKFGSCSVPQIKFGVGFDNRKETSFEPADKGQCS